MSRYYQFAELSDQDKFKEILLSKNEKVIFFLGKFIYESFKSRDPIQRRNH